MVVPDPAFIKKIDFMMLSHDVADAASKERMRCQQFISCI
jgi:hypothetical protein